jgi:tetratricopeptide (TPR) repeat protein
LNDIKADMHIYNSRGYFHHILKEYDDAIADYSAAIAMDENYDFLRLYVNRADSFRAKGCFGEALNDYDKVIEVCSDSDYNYVHDLRNEVLSILAKQTGDSTETHKELIHA